MNWKFWSSGNATQKVDTGYIARAVDSSTSITTTTEDNPISYQEAKNLYVNNPMAKKVVDRPIEAALSIKPTIKIEGCPDEIIDLVWREFKLLKIKECIFAALRDKRIYGASAIILGIDGLNPEDPYNPSITRQTDIWFNPVDSLQMTGDSICLDVNSKDYGRITKVRANGQLYSRGRFMALMNGQTIYVKFEPSAFKFAGRSVFRNIQKPLDSYMKSFDMVGRVCALTGVMIHKTSMGGAGLGLGLDMQNRANNITKLKNADGTDVISIAGTDEITNLQFQHVEEAMKARQAIIEDIASGSGVPQKLLLEDSFASLLSNGSEDYKAVMGWIKDFQESEIEPIYEWVLKILLRRVVTQNVYAAIQSTVPEMSDVHMSVALTQWLRNMEIQWESNIPLTDEERRKAQKEQHEIVLATYAITDDGEWLANELNAMDGLFQNEVLPPAPKPSMLSSGMPGIDYDEEQIFKKQEGMINAEQAPV